MNCLLKVIRRYKKSDINTILSRRNLLLLHNSYFHKKDIYETDKFLYYDPNTKDIKIYNKKKGLKISLDNINKLYRQEHLFYTDKKNNKIHNFLSYVGYDFHNVNNISQFLHDTFRLNYSIIWIDMNTIIDVDICYIIYILRVIYRHQNPIVLVSHDMFEFRLKYESDDNLLTETETPNFMSFNFIKYIEDELSIDTNLNTTELVTFHDISKENLAQFANDQFYLSCNIIKATFKKATCLKN